VKNKKKQSSDVVIKFEHLNPRVQKLIWDYEPLKIQEILAINPSKKTIKGARRLRGFLESTTSLSALILAGTQVGAYKLQSPASSTMFKIAITTGVLGRGITAHNIKKLHTKLVDSIKKNGLLQTRFEGHYPEDWINPVIVSKTHPSFHVKGNGDIVFHKTTRTEYFRIKFQERFKVAGWRWRVCLAPPVAPQTVRAWTKQKLAEIARNLPRVKPARKPVPAPAFSKKRKPVAQKKLRPRFA